MRRSIGVNSLLSASNPINYWCPETRYYQKVDKEIPEAHDNPEVLRIRADVDHNVKLVAEESGEHIHMNEQPGGRQK